MTVIVKSDKPTMTKIYICNKCAYELEYSGEDVQSKFEGDEYYSWIICPRPTCKTKNYVKEWK